MGKSLDFSDLLHPSEQRLLTHPETWRWVSSAAPPDLKPIKRPEHLEWGKTHSHAPAHREAFLALTGKTVIIFRDKVYQVTPGVVMVFNSQERHDYDLAPYHRGFRHLWLHISNRHILTSNLNEVDEDGHRTDTILKFMTGHAPRLLLDVWDACGKDATQPSIHWAFMKSLITSSFFEALSDWRHKAPTKPHQLIIDSICEHIDKHLDEDLSLERVSTLAGYSAHFFHRLFLRYKGQPLHRYIVEARLEKAKELLARGQSVTAVSEQIGMESPSYFSRFFKTHTRLTPSAWRDVHFVQ